MSDRDTPSDDVDPVRLGHFHILERLGRGGMGVVYRAEDEKLRRQVALKVLPRAFERDEERKRRFLREARSAAAVVHPNVATTFDVGEADGRVYIAMELIEGVTLRKRMGAGRLPLADALVIARQIARGMARAHDKGVVHRDLKPDNVMITAEREAKVLDFGLAKPLEPDQAADEHAATSSNVTLEGQVMGTPQYMSPEQAMGRPVDARTDVFSFGVVLYEMVTGSQPFHGTTQELMVAISRDEPVPPSKLAPGVPTALERIIARCMAKKPSDRYEAMGEVAEAFEALQSDAASPRSRRGLVPGVLVALGAVAAVALGALVLAGRASPRSSAPVGSAAALVAAASAVPIVITDGAAQTASREAASAYAAAMQALRDASTGAARRELLRAVELDPGLAAAHLRLAAIGASLQDQRAHLGAASRSRASLTERDQGMLHALEPILLADTPDFSEAAARAERLSAASPLDAELALFAAQRLWDLGRTAEASDALARALRVDPGFALVDSERAKNAFATGDLAGALAEAGRCLEISPSASDCLERRSLTYAALGQCDKLEADARREIAGDPKSAGGYLALALALGARGAPVDSLREVLHKQAELSSEPDQVSEADLKVAVWGGDFAQAESIALRMEKQAGSDPSDLRHGFQTIRLLRIYAETGQPGRAVQVAEEYARRSAAWIVDDSMWVRPEVLAVRRRSGRITDGEFRDARDGWAREVRAKRPVPLAASVWVDVFARPVASTSEAQDAVAAMPAYAVNGANATTSDAGALGRLYFFAGRMDQAIEALRREARGCNAVEGVAVMIDHIRDGAILGQALERQGDQAGACQAYGDVLARWGAAKPRSRSADVARARSRALGCAP